MVAPCAAPWSKKQVYSKPLTIVSYDHHNWQNLKSIKPKEVPTTDGGKWRILGPCTFEKTNTTSTVNSNSTSSIKSVPSTRSGKTKKVTTRKTSTHEKVKTDSKPVKSTTSKPYVPDKPIKPYVPDKPIMPDTPKSPQPKQKVPDKPYVPSKPIDTIECAPVVHTGNSTVKTNNANATSQTYSKSNSSIVRI
ncbi:hypothetical protein BC830DRAFT_1126129 [Chytriomyces sp. MP71]|nr:hypothetical protein BC830DRAFT_1126129 [Chytriomyces sp. MP71]